MDTGKAEMWRNAKFAGRFRHRLRNGLWNNSYICPIWKAHEESMRTLLSLAGFAALAALTTPLLAAGSPRPPVTAKRVAATSLKTAPGVVVRRAAPGNLEFSALGMITPALAESGLAAGRVGQTPLVSAGGVQRSQSYQSSFSFTPSGRVSDNRDFSLGMTSRVQGVSDAASGSPLNSNAVANMNVGFALGYRGFALEGGYNRIARATRSLAEGVDVGVSYRGADWKTSLKVSQEAIEPDPYGFASFLTPERRRAVEFGGAYQVARGVALTGALRYQLAYPDALTFGVSKKGQPEVDAGTIFFGTAVSF
jgi:hypothetical protein